MFCPNCGNECGDGKFCAECGCELPKRDGEGLSSTAEPPVGRYDGLDGYIELSFFTVTICKEGTEKPSEHVMLYEDIAGVAFQRACDDGIGYLAIWDAGHDGSPVLTESNAACDDSAILFAEDMSSEFSKVYKYFDKSVKKNQLAGKNSLTKSKVKGKTNSAVCVRCPKFNSERCIIYEKEIRPTRSRFRLPNLLVALIWGALWLYVIFMKRRTYECLECGHRWT